MKVFNDNILTNIASMFKLKTFIRNYESSFILCDILDIIMNYEGDMDISVERFHIKIESEDFEFDGWNANKYYAWLSQGYFTPKSDRMNIFDSTYHWASEMPSYYMMAEFRDWLREKMKEKFNTAKKK